jgi:hypothetical protein
MPYKDLGMYNMMSSEGPGFGSAADLGIVKPQTFSGSAPGTGGVLGVTNDLPGGGSGLDSSLKDIISKITGFGSSDTGGRRLEALTSLAGNMFGMQKQGMSQAASMEEKRLGEAGATERTNISVQPSLMEQKRKSSLFPSGTTIGGLGGAQETGEKKPTTTISGLFDEWMKKRVGG